MEGDRKGTRETQLAFATKTRPIDLLFIASRNYMLTLLNLINLAESSMAIYFPFRMSFKNDKTEFI